MSIVFGPSTIVLRRMVYQYNGSFSGVSYGDYDPPFYVVQWHNRRRIILPFYWRNKSVEINSHQKDIEVYFN